jgi:hypothetical protein
MTKGMTQAMFWMGYGLTAVWAIALRIALPLYPPGAPRMFLLRPFAFGLGLVVANTLAISFSLRVRRDFPRGARMRLAWLLFALSCAIALLRYGLLWAAWASASTPLLPIPLPALLLGTALMEGGSLLVLLAALVLMWSCLARLRLGRLHAPDWFAVAAIAIATPALSTLREIGPLAAIRSAVIVQLQYLDPVLIACCAIAGIVLLRTGRDVGGGGLTASFFYIGAFGLVRLAALVVPLLPVPGIEWIEPPFTAASLASDWLIALAVWRRWRVTVEATELVKQYDSQASGV